MKEETLHEKRTILDDPEIRALLDGIANVPERHKAALEAGNRAILWACKREAQSKEKDALITAPT